MAYFRETDCEIIAGMKKAHLCLSLQKIRRYPLLLKEQLKNKNIRGYENKRRLVCSGASSFYQKRKKTVNFNWCTLNGK